MVLTADLFLEGSEPRTLHMLSKCSTAVLQPCPFLVLVRGRVLLTCVGRPELTYRPTVSDFSVDGSWCALHPATANLEECSFDVQGDTFPTISGPLMSSTVWNLLGLQFPSPSWYLPTTQAFFVHIPDPGTLLKLLLPSLTQG